MFKKDDSTFDSNSLYFLILFIIFCVIVGSSIRPN